MKLERDAITTLASEGHCTLQVPTLVLFSEHDADSVVYEDFPDDWFVVLSSSAAPALGKEGGFTHLTRKGYAANKDALKKAFEASAGRGRNTWASFEREAEEHFAQVEKARDNKLKLLRAKVAELEKLVL